MKGKLAAVIAMGWIVGGCGDHDGQSFRVELGEWTAESNRFTFYMGADSAIFPDKFTPIAVQPHYRADTVYYGTIAAGFRGDTAEDIQYHVVKDMGAAGEDLFYFDANNNEDLTDDGLPLRWEAGRDDATGRYVEFRMTTPYGYPIRVQVRGVDDPVDKMLSARFGRTVQTYGMQTFSARRGEWVVESDTLPLELFTLNPSGRVLGTSGEWFILDVDRNGVFEFIPPDIRVLLDEPEFEFGGRTWSVAVDTLGDVLTIVQSAGKSGIDQAAPRKAPPVVSESGTTELAVGSPAPAFSIADLEGRRLDLDSLRGQVVVLNFWHTGCMPCRVEQPDLNGLVMRYAGKPVVFIAPTFNDSELVGSYLREYPFSYRVVTNAADLVGMYRVGVFPAHFVIDQAGVVRYCASGGGTGMDVRLASVIDSLL